MRYLAPACAIVLAGSIAACDPMSRDSSANITDKGNGDSGYFARDAEILETGSDGKTLYVLHAATITQSAPQSAVNLDTVTMRYQTGAGDDYDLRAQSATVDAGGKRFTLTGAVQVDGSGPDKPRPLRLRTDSLQFDVEAERITSAATVEILFAEQRLTGVGLDADLKARKVQLESQIHGQFQP